MPFFKLLKKQNNFEWTTEAQAAFDDLKRFLTSPSVLTPPLEGEKLLLYIGATTNMVNTVIAVEREEARHVYKVRRPVYYVSEVLTESKVCYP